MSKEKLVVNIENLNVNIETFNNNPEKKPTSNALDKFINNITEVIEPVILEVVNDFHLSKFKKDTSCHVSIEIRDADDRISLERLEGSIKFDQDLRELIPKEYREQTTSFEYRNEGYTKSISLKEMDFDLESEDQVIFRVEKIV